jgi:hypothetical protein
MTHSADPGSGQLRPQTPKLLLRVHFSKRRVVLTPHDWNEWFGMSSPAHETGMQLCDVTTTDGMLRLAGRVPML